jgi:shingomyelin synthase
MVSRKVLGADYIDWFELPDIFVSSYGSLLVCFLVLHPKRLLILRRLAVIFGYLNLLRAYTVIVTSLPDASPECAKQFMENATYKEQSVPVAIVSSMRRAFLLVIEAGQHITCGDMIFSGHTVFMTICTMVILQYCREVEMPYLSERVCKATRVWARLFLAAGVMAIIGTKLHYTLDVSIALFLTIQVFAKQFLPHGFHNFF